MNDAELENWFAANQHLLESAYLAEQEPWKQSGFSGSQDRWVICRKPIAACIDQPGCFLDIGCANGYLLECSVKWLAERAVDVIPYGLDISPSLANLAKQRLPDFASHIFVGNSWTWTPPFQFDFVRTELIYVPEELREAYVERSLQIFVKPGGKLLIAEYRSRKDAHLKQWMLNECLQQWNISVEHYQSGVYQGQELTRVAVIKNSLH
ncbi:MAG: class I SAM-dependent methyltransferase [Leptolyngbyaceae cyanobacterium RU_5_1]|nr:class I SAM-dependent methyltransferase [Leptolyngbyaceae cyanobacterium RU_5_1]